MLKVKTNQQLEVDAQKNICDFVLANHSDNDLFINNGVGRKFYSTKKSTNISDFLKHQRKIYFSKLNLDYFKEEPMFEIFIGVNTEQGSVHLHTDDTEEGYVHFRLNFLVSKPEAGGNPVIEGQEFDIAERGSWINLASEWRHKSVPVIGIKPRIVLSFGALITKNQVKMVTQKCNI